MLKFDNGYIEYEKIGKFTLKNEWIHPRRTIDSTELIVVISGTLYIGEDGRDYVLGENDAIILERGRVHYGTRPTAEPLSFYWLHFRTDMPAPFKTLTGAEMHDVKYFLKKLLHISNTKGTSTEEIEALTLLILKEAERQYQAAKDSPPAIIGLVKEYVRNNLSAPQSVSSVAKEFGYNKDYLGKLFLKHSGEALKDYIAKSRIAFAENLLLTTNVSIKELASELGYADENAFIKFFKYHKKISPTNFRNLCFNTHVNDK